MNHDARPLRERLDDYLDGRLSESAAAEFRAAAQNDPQLREELALQDRIDASLSRGFVAPDAGAILARIQAARHAAAAHADADIAPEEPARPTTIRIPAPTKSSPFRRWFGVAAAVAILLGGGASYYLWDSAQFQLNGPSRYVARQLAVVYTDEVGAGFAPRWECRELPRFRETFVNELGHALAFTAIPPDAKVWGISYSATQLSDRTVEILAKIGDTPIVVFVDKLENDKQSILAEQTPGLHLFRETRGNLVLYELSPHDKATVLPLLTAPSCPKK